MGGPCNCSNLRVHCDAHAWPVLAAVLDKFFGLVAVCVFHLLLRVVSWGLYLRRLLLGVVCQGLCLLCACWRASAFRARRGASASSRALRRLFARWGCASDPRRKAGAFCGCSRVSATRPGARALRGLSVSCAPPLPPTTLAAARRGGVGHCAWSAGRPGRGRPTASSLHWRDGRGTNNISILARWTAKHSTWHCCWARRLMLGLCLQTSTTSSNICIDTPCGRHEFPLAGRFFYGPAS